MGSKNPLEAESPGQDVYTGSAGAVGPTLRPKPASKDK